MKWSRSIQIGLGIIILMVSILSTYYFPEIRTILSEQPVSQQKKPIMSLINTPITNTPITNTPITNTPITNTPITNTPPITTPPITNIIGEDSFQRVSSNIGWGIASDAQPWVITPLNSTGAFTIINNTGRISALNTNFFTALLGPSATDSIIQSTFSVSTFDFVHNTINIGVVGRYTDANNLYKLYIDGQHLILIKRFKGQATILSSIAFRTTPNTLYRFRFQLVGPTLSARVWQNNQPDPLIDQIVKTDQDLQKGFCGIRATLITGNSATLTAYEASKPGV